MNLLPLFDDLIRCLSMTVAGISLVGCATMLRALWQEHRQDAAGVSPPAWSRLSTATC